MTDVIKAKTDQVEAPISVKQASPQSPKEQDPIYHDHLLEEVMN